MDQNDQYQYQNPVNQTWSPGEQNTEAVFGNPQRQPPWAGPYVRVVRETKVWPIVLGAVLSALVTFLCCFIVFRLSSSGFFDIPTPQAQNGSQQPASNETNDAVWDRKLSEIKSYIDGYFIGDVDEDKLADAAAAGMIEGLNDEWSYYISAEDYDAYLENATNSYVGIGVTISTENTEKGIEIIDVTPDSPAYQAGLEIGDLIVAVEGVPVLDGSEEAIDLNETKNRVRGEEGTSVTLTISHEGVTRDVTILRAKIKTVNVTWELLDSGLAYIRIRNFEAGAAEDTIAAIEEARAQNAKGLIFDVRYNPGGYKHELVRLLDYLLPEGPLFRSVDYNGRESVDYSDEACLDMPMAVLVNYDSYSAAEFFAAALQEYKAAVIVGEQTYGKGRFQTVFDLRDGSAINISIGQYTTPNGVSLVGKGITPDHVVELTDEQKMDLYYSRLEKEDDDQLQKAIEVLTAP